MKNNVKRFLVIIVTMIIVLTQQTMANELVVVETHTEESHVTVSVEGQVPSGITVVIGADNQPQDDCQINVEALDTSSKTADAILQACHLTTEVFLNRSDSHYSLTGDLVFGDIAKSYADCNALCSASYVAMILYSSGVLSEEYINRYNYQWIGAGGISTMIEDAGWYKVPTSQVLPGDVLIDEYELNTVIYAGNGKVWGLNTCIGSKTRTPYLTDIEVYQVWRAPA